VPFEIGQSTVYSTTRQHAGLPQLPTVGPLSAGPSPEAQTATIKKLATSF